MVKIFSRCRFFISLLLLIFLVAQGCASKEEQQEKHWQKAKQYIEKSQFREAALELKNVVKLDPSNDAAYYELGDVYMHLKQGHDAFQAFSRAASVNPENLQAQLRLGQLLLMGNQPAEAEEKAKIVLAKEPQNIEGLQLLSGVKLQLKDIDSATEIMEKAVSANSNHLELQLSLGRLYMLKGDLTKAEKIFAAAVTLDPLASDPRVALSRAYAMQGKWGEAEAELTEMIRLSEERYQNYPILAGFYESRSAWDKAEEVYKKAAEIAGQKDLSPHINLAAFYAKRGAFEKAMAILTGVSASKPDDLEIQVQRAQIQFDFGKRTEADGTISKVLEKDAGHVRANFLKGRILLGEGDFNNADSRFAIVLKEDPRNGQAHYFRGLSLLGKREKERAVQSLVKAVELNPLYLEPRLLLADIYLREGNQALARQQIEAALNRAPENLNALSLNGRLKLLANDLAGAESVFKRVVELAPGYVPGYFQLGELYRLMKKDDAALLNFEKAIELSPFHYEALGLATDVYLQKRNFDRASQLCEDQRKRIAGNPSHSAFIDYLEGRIFLAKKDDTQAQSYFEKAIEQNPNLLPPYQALAGIYVRTKRFQEAIAQYEVVLGRKPDFIPAFMALGTIYDELGEKEKAESSYRRALELDKEFVPAAHHLAWNLAERQINLDEALSLAQLAKNKQPDDPYIMDTLGWIYYLKESYLNAAAELEDSLAKLPNNPIVNYHLGKVNYKLERYEKARELMRKALEIDPNFKGADDARLFVSR